jgi:hypothetical protein
MSSVDDMDSSSDDEFESIEPTIGFASSSSLPGSRNYSPKPGTKGPKGRNAQNSKAKAKVSNTKQSTSNTKPVTQPVPASNPTNGSSSVTSMAKTPLQNQSPILVGFSPSPVQGTGIRLQPPPILLTSLSGSSNPINVMPAISSASLSQNQPTAANTPPTIKLTPRLVTSTIGTNKLLSALTPGVALMPESGHSSFTSAVRTVASFNSINTATVTGNSNIILLNGPANNKDAAGSQSDGAKNPPANVFRIHYGQSSQSFITSVNNSTPITSKQNFTTSKISGPLGSTLVSPITLQDLNFSLNSDGNVVQTNSSTTEQKLNMSDSAEEKVDDLSVLDGNPFDSIPNLSDEFFDLDLVEVCDFQ